MSFSFSGGVEVYGFISPTDITDQYPVIDPLYGIDGFRNVNTLSDLNSIPNLRRRAGMVVGISGGTTYYKLNSSPWNGTISDWSLFQTGGGSFTGGTVSGATEFTNGLTANTLTVNGVIITGDTYTTGGTYSAGTIDFNYNSGGGYQVIGLYTGQSSYVNSLNVGIGLSGNSTTGNITIVNTDPDQIVTISGGTGILTGGTYPNFTITNTLPDQVVSISGGTNIQINGVYPNFGVDFTGQTTFDYLPLSGGTVSGDTIFTSGLTANTLNINGVNITGDTYVTGGTYYTGGTIIFDYNTSGNFPVTGLTEDLNNAIAGLAETDELTIELDVATNKIRLKDIVAAGSGGTRTFQGDIIVESGLTATTAFIINTQWTLDFMDALALEIYAPNDISIDSIINLVNSPTTTILVNNSPYTPTTLITSGDKINVVTDINSVIQFNITNYL